ncbi:FAD-dependent oxidoreductase [Azospirillum sp. A23]|uniref:FAD-dependent oxidoreductase n=1 Tax=Azospirillum sp. A23 TaxID=3160608 RepID=UPI0036F34A2B
MTEHGNTQQAAVIGAGIAGLIACAVLAKSFQRVFLVDQDDLPDGAQGRKATPQAVHVHALLQSGRDVLARLFPGFEAAARSAGCLDLKVRSQWRTFSSGRWMEPTDTGLSILSQTRPLLEHLLRTQVLALPVVRLVKGRVCGLETDCRGGVAAVRLTDGQSPERLRAELVIDATGRGGHGDSWLTAVGCPAPPVETSFPEVRYTSALFSRSVTAGDELAGWLNLADAPATCGAVLAPVERGRWIATATDRFSCGLPKDEEGFRGFIAALSDGRIASLLARERLLTDIRSFRIASVRLKRFDAIAGRLPEGYLPIGDTLATFNPLYAQGMAVAALQARPLEHALAAAGAGEGWRRRLAEAYVPAAMVPARWAWLLGQAVDLNYSQFRGDRCPEALELNRMLRRAFAASLGRPRLMERVDRVLHLLDAPESLDSILGGHGPAVVSGTGMAFP